eukprot:1156027-Pelagomonas_calceolata.AAC.2
MRAHSHRREAAHPWLPFLTPCPICSLIQCVNGPTNSHTPYTVIPPFHNAVDAACSYLSNDGFLGVADFFVSGKYDLPMRQMPWLRRFFWRYCTVCFTHRLHFFVSSLHDPACTYPPPRDTQLSVQQADQSCACDLMHAEQPSTLTTLTLGLSVVFTWSTD